MLPDKTPMRLTSNLVAVLKFSCTKSTLAGIPLTNALGENSQFSLQIMLTSCPFYLVIVWLRYLLSGWGQSHIFRTCAGEPVVRFFSEEDRFFPDIDRGTSGGDFENYAEPTTHVFRCF